MQTFVKEASSNLVRMAAATASYTEPENPSVDQCVEECMPMFNGLRSGGVQTLSHEVRVGTPTRTVPTLIGTFLKHRSQDYMHMLLAVNSLHKT